MRHEVLNGWLDEEQAAALLQRAIQAEQRVKELEAKLKHVEQGWFILQDQLIALEDPLPVLTRYDNQKYEFDLELFDLCRDDDYAAIYHVIRSRILAALAAQGSDGQAP